MSVQLAAGSTITLAAELVIVPTVFAKTARYSYPDCECLALAMVSVLVVVPPLLVVLALSAVSFAHSAPESLENCHCALADGFADAAAVSETVLPSAVAWLSGCVLTGPIQSTVSEAALEVALPAALVKIARYS